MRDGGTRCEPVTPRKPLAQYWAMPCHAFGSAALAAVVQLGEPPTDLYRRPVTDVLRLSNRLALGLGACRSRRLVDWVEGFKRAR